MNTRRRLRPHPRTPSRRPGRLVVRADRPTTVADAFEIAAFQLLRGGR